ncbi:ABC transporter ATP-binding protein [Peredibacter starrii]|uniref:ABC transporter ATP-binding protein n=1 Tax=Peredibacter starrii TaxID=28202 RepID=A0AAX4HP52_9BACT|nr:ABC transporter ATP-binding protein [Peredibacter starrii]WPU64950.1 ABC transporter ATP-binding protein [Peredibacter starrii]
MLKVLKSMFPYIRPFWKEALVATLLALPLAGIKAYEAYLVKDIFDKGFSAGSTFEDARNLALLLVFLGVLNYPLRYFHYFGLRQVVDKSTRVIRSKIYLKFQNLPAKFYSKQKAGNLISTIMNDTSVFSEAFKNSLEVVREPITALALLGVAFYHDWQLTLVIFAVAPLFIITLHFTGKRIRKYVGRAQSDNAEMTHIVGEALNGQKIIKAFGLKEYIIDRFERTQEMLLFHRRKSNSAEEHSHPLVELIGSIAFAVVIVFAHHRITSGSLTTGGFISFVAALAMFMDPVRRYSKANAKLNQAQAAASRIFELLSVEEEPQGDLKELKSFDKTIEFRNVSFTYGEGTVLKGFNLVITKGEKIGLVGLSGSGKSTLISLLLRLYDVTGGEILIDGVNINEYTLASVRKVFALVSQDVFLFNDTVRENLTTGDEHTDEEIMDALKISYAWEYVKDLPQQLDTQIGDRGLRLSGGQSQRLTIARAFLKNRDVLLFDEATSALDNESEKIVQAALDRVAGHKTVIAVAHRLSTLKDFNRIVVMKDGVKIEEGTHPELIALNGEYRKLFELSQRE